MARSFKALVLIGITSTALFLCVSSLCFACTWCIEKSADVSEITLSAGEQYRVTYTIKLIQSGTCDPNYLSSAAIYDTNLPINPGYERECSGTPAAYLDWFTCQPGVESRTFTKVYTINVGPYYRCGDYTVVNTACLPDWVSECGNSSWTIRVHVPCEGCTLTQGYWKTHSKYGPAPYDDAWALVSPSGEDSAFFSSGKTWYEVLWTAPKRGNVYYVLAHQFIAAKLNILNGASSTPEVDQALLWAENFFDGRNPSDPLSDTIRKNALKRANLLDRYNNGYIGPGHCSE